MQQKLAWTCLVWSGWVGGCTLADIANPPPSPPDVAPALPIRSPDGPPSSPAGPRAPGSTADDETQPNDDPVSGGTEEGTTRPDGTDPGVTGDLSCLPPSPTTRRLNRMEFDHTIRDLTGLDLGLARDFPADDFGYGFDNIGAVLTVSPLLVEKWESAVETIVDQVIARDQNLVDPAAATILQAEAMATSIGGPIDEGWNLWSDGEIPFPWNAPRTGRYRVAIRAYGHQAGPDPVAMDLRNDTEVLASFVVEESTYQTFEAEVFLEQGPVALFVAFTNDFFSDVDGDRNLIVDHLSITDLADDAGADLSAQQVIRCDLTTQDPAVCARTIFTHFATRAWRRPVSSAEIDRLLAFLDIAAAEGDDAITGVKLGLMAILLSPHFLYRIEEELSDAEGDVRALNPYELASRLSYFLYASMPDDELFAAAADGSLLQEEVLIAQLNRMIADEKSQAFVDSFAGQWLFSRGVRDAFLDLNRYPEWDDALAAAMEMETALVFQEFLRSDRSMLDLFDADFTYVNDRLAEHYGLPGDFSESWTRVLLDEQSPRRGVLTHGAFLTVTSLPTRTSPVKRGKLILEQLLCIAPPPPPPGVEGLPEEVDPTASLRERFEQHRQDPVCASCHTVMDPLGFALEHFDGVGAWRDDDHGFAIDSSGLYMGVTHFEDHRELLGLLKQDPLVADCITQKSLTYAIGHGIDDEDRCAIDSIRADFADGGYRMRDLFTAIVQSDAFRQKRRQTSTP